MSTGKVLLGVLAGVAAGAVLGILFAPEKGSETRRKISKKGKDYADDLRNRFDEFLSTASETFERGKEEASEFTQNVKNKANSVKGDSKSSMY